MSERDMDQPIADMPYDTKHSHIVWFLGTELIWLRQTRDNLFVSKVDCEIMSKWSCLNALPFQVLYEPPE